LYNRDGALLFTLSAPSRLFRARFTPDDRSLLGSGVGGAFVWDLASHALVEQLIGHSDMVFDSALDPSGRLAVTAGVDHKAMLWAVTSDALAGLELDAPFAAADVSPDEGALLVAGDDGTVRRWDLVGGPARARDELHGTFVRVAADGRTLALATGNQAALVHGGATGRALPVVDNV